MMGLRTPLGRAMGLGSAKEGVSHWWWQRVTSVVLIPLSLWFVFSLASLVGADYPTVVDWMRSPIVTALLIMFVISTFYHAQLGVQVVIEDYIHTEWLKMASSLALSFVTAFVILVAVVLVLRVALGV
jgi:succinate dehydrogenase / fumarate reductase membrane anchor subunit